MQVVCGLAKVSFAKPDEDGVYINPKSIEPNKSTVRLSFASPSHGQVLIKVASGSLAQSIKNGSIDKKFESPLDIATYLLKENGILKATDCKDNNSEPNKISIIDCNAGAVSYPQNGNYHCFEIDLTSANDSSSHIFKFDNGDYVCYDRDELASYEKEIRNYNDRMRAKSTLTKWSCNNIPTNEPFDNFDTKFTNFVNLIKALELTAGTTGGFHIFIQGSASSDPFKHGYPEFAPHYPENAHDSIYKYIPYTCVGTGGNLVTNNVYDVTEKNKPNEYGAKPSDLPMLRCKFIYEKIIEKAEIDVSTNQYVFIHLLKGRQQTGVVNPADRNVKAFLFIDKYASKKHYEEMIKASQYQK